jgi:two-component system, NtrC family, nitrogen regulation sensor histidine kinase NtrY
VSRAGRPARRGLRLSWDFRLFLLLAVTAIPSVTLLVLFGIGRKPSTALTVTITVTSVLCAVLVAIIVRKHVLHHIRTVSSLIEGMRLQDYSAKGARVHDRGELAELYQQVNSLMNGLQVGRQGEQELLSILEKVVDQIGVAIVVCDSRDRIQMANGVASTLLGVPAEKLIGVDLSDTALADVPVAEEPRVLDHGFPGGEGKWQVAQQQYRHQGRPSRIIFITDVKQVLSQEELAVWQRLIRVVSHEVNNSLTPITSLCQTLATLLSKPQSSQYTGDVLHGLEMIGQRAKGLKEFISAYARIARVPDPQKVLFPVTQLVERVQSLFPQGRVTLLGEIPDVSLFGDPAHLEQALINLIKNGLEASSRSPDGDGEERDEPLPVRMSCAVRGDSCEFQIVDDGSGISNPENLFVPLYTTKSGGSGIGLALCRQIAAKHFGYVTLENRSDAQGAVARLIIPLPSQY